MKNNLPRDLNVRYRLGHLGAIVAFLALLTMFVGARTWNVSEVVFHESGQVRSPFLSMQNWSP
jgi:hypothetical protein